MKTIYANPRRIIATAFIASVLLSGMYTPAFAQQHIIADKDNTRPDINNTVSSPAFINSFSVQKGNGYNEIKWSAFREQETRKYTVEYSANGVDYQSAGEILVNNTASYSLKHVTNDTRAALYRVRIEQLNGRFINSESMFVGGDTFSPVSFYPTIITGNTINLNAAWPIERMVIVSTNGQQVFAKDLNGETERIPVVIPSLGKGIYFMSFYGSGWKSTEKFIIP